MTISVRASHIKRGTKTRFGNPIAWAIAEQLASLFRIIKWDTETGFWIEVDDISVVWESAFTVYEWFLPMIARDFLVDFKAGRNVNPVTFDLTR